SNYVGVFGTGDPSDIPGRDFGNGTFFRNKPVRLRDYLDGTSNTIAVGERSRNLSRATWTGTVTQAAVPVTILQAEDGLDPEGGDALVIAHPGELDGLNSIPDHADQFCRCTPPAPSSCSPTARCIWSRPGAPWRSSRHWRPVPAVRSSRQGPIEFG